MSNFHIQRSTVNVLVS